MFVYQLHLPQKIKRITHLFHYPFTSPERFRDTNWVTHSRRATKPELFATNIAVTILLQELLVLKGNDLESNDYASLHFNTCWAPQSFSENHSHWLRVPNLFGSCPLRAGLSSAALCQGLMFIGICSLHDHNMAHFATRKCTIFHRRKRTRKG